MTADSQHPRIAWQENLDSSALWAVKLKSRDFHEVAVTYGLVLLALWTPNPLQTGFAGSSWLGSYQRLSPRDKMLVCSAFDGQDCADRSGSLALPY